MSVQKKIAKNAFHNFLVKAIALTFGFIASVVVARFLGPEKYGVYSLVMWILYIVGLSVNLGIPTTITKYVSEYWGRKDFSATSSILNRLLRFELIAGVVVSLALFFCAPLVARWYNNPDLSLYLRFASLVIVPMGLMWLYNGLFCGLQRYDLIAKINLVTAPTTLGVFILVIHLGAEIEWLVAVSGVNNLLLVAGYLHLKRTRFDLLEAGGARHDFGGKLFKFSASVFVVILLDAIVWERFGIFFLSVFSTPSEIAFYNVAFIFSSRTMILLPGALTGILLPAMSEVYGGGNREELARVHANSTRYLAMLSFPLCLGGIAIARQMFPTLYGPSFQPASFVFAILVLGGAVGSVATSSSSLLYGAERQRTVVQVGVLSAVIGVLAGWLLVPIYQAKGAAMAGALAQITGGLVMIFYAFKIYMKRRFPTFGILRILLASALMGMVAFLMIESVRGTAGLILALIVSPPLYILSLLLTRSLTSEDIELVTAAIGQLPDSLGRVIQSAFKRLVGFFYPGV